MTAPFPWLGESGADEPVIITALEFDVLWEHLALDAMPLVLRVPSPGRTDAERAKFVRHAWDTLSSRGLGRPVDLDPRLHRLMSLLRRPDREIDGRMWVGHQLRLFAAAMGDEAVLATMVGSQLTLRPADASGLARYALSVLPEAPAGPGQSITLRTADFEAAAQEATDQQRLAAELAGRGVRQSDAEQLADMIGDVVNQGQFGCAVRDKWGRRVRAGRVISFFDTKDGRYLQIRRESDGGEAWTTISPADGRRMLQHLSALHDEQLPMLGA
jgi:ESX secretion-associated protein EspG